MNFIAQLCGLILCVFVGVLGLTILFLIWTGKINLSALLNEANGQASMSRFQLLIFTFVIATSLFELVGMQGKFPDIPSGVLTLLGISASTYAVGKGISYSQPELLMQQSASVGNVGAAAKSQPATDQTNNP